MGSVCFTLFQIIVELYISYTYSTFILFIFFLTTQNAFPHLGNSPPSIYYNYFITIFMLILSKITTNTVRRVGIYKQSGECCSGSDRMLSPQKIISHNTIGSHTYLPYPIHILYIYPFSIFF